MSRSMKLWILLAIAASSLHAETGYDVWFRYAHLDAPPGLKSIEIPAVVVALGDSKPIQSARDEDGSRVSWDDGRDAADRIHSAQGKCNCTGDVEQPSSVDAPTRA